MIAYLKSLHDGQSVESLREETHGLVQKNAERIGQAEKRLQ